MALKNRLTADEHAALPPLLQEHYAKSGDGYEVQVEGLEGLKNALARERDKRRTWRRRAEGVDEELQRVGAKLLEQPPTDDDPESPTSEFMAAQRHRLAGLQGAEHRAMVEQITDEWFESPEGAAVLAEGRAKVEAENLDKIAKLTASRDRILIDIAARKIASQIGKQGAENLFLPSLIERLAIEERDGEPVVIARNKQGSNASLEALADEFRTDPAFAPVIRGNSPVEKAQHERRVAEMLKGPGNPGVTKPLTREQFGRLSPESRAAHVSAGGIITD